MVEPSPDPVSPASLVDRIGTTVVGRRREIELVVAALIADRHILIEGPPGTGKSTLLRSVAQELGVGFEFVEGNAELTPARLVGPLRSRPRDGRGVRPERVRRRSAGGGAA